jgi:ribonuclease HII
MNNINQIKQAVPAEKLQLSSSLHDFDASYGGIVCGIDEAGRGCLAGDVFAAAVVLDKDKPIQGLDDSKKLTPLKREQLYDEIITNCTAYAIATVSVEEIEEINILRAALLAMKRAHEQIVVKTDVILIDGNIAPDIEKCLCVIKGDSQSASIAAASILAKVARDRYMQEIDRQYPEYQFAKHKGYATKLHREMLLEYGVSPVHRDSFLGKIIAKAK